jgi:hypothetical protein
MGSLDSGLLLTLSDVGGQETKDGTQKGANPSPRKN